jgi:hypothetical protein
MPASALESLVERAREQASAKLVERAKGSPAE